MGKDQVEDIDQEIIDSVSQDVEGKYLTFWIENQMFCVSISHIVQIVQMQPITEVPEYPIYVKGIINLRGSIIPVVDVRLRLGKMEAEYNDHTCIIICQTQGTEVGFIVDRVEEVADIDDQNISPPPPIASDRTSDYFMGVAKFDGKVILMMETQRMISDDMIHSFTKLGGIEH